MGGPGQLCDSEYTLPGYAELATRVVNQNCRNIRYK